MGGEQMKKVRRAIAILLAFFMTITVFRLDVHAEPVKTGIVQFRLNGGEYTYDAGEKIHKIEWETGYKLQISGVEGAADVDGGGMLNFRDLEEGTSLVFKVNEIPAEGALPKIFVGSAQGTWDDNNSCTYSVVYPENNQIEVYLQFSSGEEPVDPEIEEGILKLLGHDGQGNTASWQDGWFVYESGFSIRMQVGEGDSAVSGSLDGAGDLVFFSVPSGTKVLIEYQRPEGDTETNVTLLRNQTVTEYFSDENQFAFDARFTENVNEIMFEPEFGNDTPAATGTILFNPAGGTLDGDWFVYNNGVKILFRVGEGESGITVETDPGNNVVYSNVPSGAKVSVQYQMGDQPVSKVYLMRSVGQGEGAREEFSDENSYVREEAFSSECSLVQYTPGFEQGDPPQPPKEKGYLNFVCLEETGVGGDVYFKLNNDTEFRGAWDAENEKYAPVDLTDVNSITVRFKPADTYSLDEYRGVKLWVNNEIVKEYYEEDVSDFLGNDGVKFDIATILAGYDDPSDLILSLEFGFRAPQPQPYFTFGITVGGEHITALDYRVFDQETSSWSEWKDIRESMRITEPLTCGQKFGVRLSLEDGYSVDPNNLFVKYQDQKRASRHIYWELDDSAVPDPEQTEEVIGMLTGENGYTFTFEPDQQIYDMPHPEETWMAMQITLIRAFDETVKIYGWGNEYDHSASVHLDNLIPKLNFEFDQFYFNENSVPGAVAAQSAAETGCVEMGGYKDGSEPNILTFRTLDPSEILGIYVTAGKLENPTMEDFTAEMLVKPNEEGRYTVELEPAECYTFYAKLADPVKVCIGWSTNPSDEGKDYYVGGGNVFVERITRKGKVLLEDADRDGVYEIDLTQDPASEVSVDDDPEYSYKQVNVLNGDEVMLRLVPFYGYQMVQSDFGDAVMRTEENACTFTFEMHGNNVHFSASFKPAENEVLLDDDNSLKDAEFTLPEDMELPGSVCMGVKEVELSGEEASAARKEVVSGTEDEVLQVFDVNMVNFQNKGNEKSYVESYRNHSVDRNFWYNEVTDLGEKTAKVSLSLSEASKARMMNDSEYYIIREHVVDGRSEYQMLDADYADGILTFDTDKFCNFMLVQKNGFWTIDGKRYYYRDGKKVINKIIKVENASYYCGATGEIQTGWQTIGDNKYYFAANGIMKTGKVKVGSFYYYFAANGIMKTGKVKIGNYYYYFSPAAKTLGQMQTGLQTIGKKKYYFSPATKTLGQMQTGLQTISKKKYYFSPVTKTLGQMQTGLQTIKQKRYYFAANGIMKTGKVKIGSFYYYFAANGIMKTGKVQIGKYYYYFSTATKTLGQMQKGWQKIGTKQYYFSPATKTFGQMQTGWLKVGTKYYYLSPAAKTLGQMQTGWLKIGTKWYYFLGTGAMVTGTRKIGTKTYKFNSSGVCLNK